MFGSFQLIQKIANGHSIDSKMFTEIYKCKNIKNNLELAIKLEPIQTKNPILF